MMNNFYLSLDFKNEYLAESREGENDHVFGHLEMFFVLE